MTTPNDRENLTAAIWTAPDRKSQFEFQYTDFARESQRKITPFIYPHQDGASHQDRGVGLRRFPMRIYISGEDYETRADNFYIALEQIGASVLQHPIYGTFNVFPGDRILRNDALATADGQAVFELEFWETVVSPAQTVPIAARELEAEAQVTVTVTAATEEFAAAVDAETFTEKDDLASTTTDLLSLTKFYLRSLSQTVQSVQSEFDTAATLINDNIDALIEDPLTLGQQVYDLIRAPVRALDTLENKLIGFRNLFDRISRSLFEVTTDNVASNSYVITNAYLGATVLASAESVLRTQAISRREMLNGIDSLFLLSGDYGAWIDTVTRDLSLIDTGETYSSTLLAVSAITKTAVESLFDLKIERVLILDRPRNFLELCAQIYKTELESKLDEFINTNELNGNELIEIPQGREIVYYV